MRRDLDRVALGRHSRPRVLELADQLLLLGVDRDRRLTRGDRRGHPLVDQPELHVAIGMLRALQRLAIGLQAVAQRAQQRGDRRVMDLVTLLAQLAGELSHALGGPQQDLHRIAATVVGDEPLQAPRPARDRSPRSACDHHRAGAHDRPRAARPTSISRIPLRIVFGEIPLALATAAIPPRPSTRASDAAQIRRATLTELRRQRPEPLTDQPLIDHAPGVLRARTTILHLIYLRRLRLLDQCCVGRIT